MSPNRWEHDIKHLTTEQIRFAVRCSTWQDFRLGMKGVDTKTKLFMLESWLIMGSTCNHCTGEIRQHQVDNYLNALKRGGQLDLEGNVVR
jgi:hypothetical protein